MLVVFFNILGKEEIGMVGYELEGIEVVLLDSYDKLVVDGELG